MIDRVIAFHGSKIESSAVACLLKAEIPTLFLDRVNRPIGRLLPAKHPNPARLAEQSRISTCPKTRLRFSREVTVAKIRASLEHLRDHCGNHPTEKLRQCAKTLTRELAAARASESEENLRGHEGMAAAAYYRALGSMVRHPAFAFSKRTRRPPEDPVNALLSLAYSMLARQAENILLAHGLEPTLGFHHALVPGRPSLALDLMEPFRIKVVDRLVLSMINRSELKPEHFRVDETPSCRLTEEGRSKFIPAFEKRLRMRPKTEGRRTRSLLDDIETEAHRFRRRLAGEDPAWLPFSQEEYKET